VFRDLGSRYTERLGTGIRRMALAMEGHGLPRPRFEEVGSEFRVALMGPGKRFMKEVATRPAWAKGCQTAQYKHAGDEMEGRENIYLIGVMT
jgi:predicted HTH transcriptional regulator